MHLPSLHPTAPGWETLEDQTVFANPYAEVHLVKVRTPMRPGPEGVPWTVVQRKSGCVIAPMTADGCFVLVRQERIPVRAELWEFPAGQIDETGELTSEIIRTTALRELREECGYDLPLEGELLPMGLFFTTVGVSNEKSYLFLARPVIPSPEGPRHEESEAISACRAFSKEELQEMIATGEIRDANTLAAFARMTALGMLETA